MAGALASTRMTPITGGGWYVCIGRHRTLWRYGGMGAISVALVGVTRNTSLGASIAYAPGLVQNSTMLSFGASQKNGKTNYGYPTKLKG